MEPHGQVEEFAQQAGALVIHSCVRFGTANGRMIEWSSPSVLFALLTLVAFVSVEHTCPPVTTQTANSVS